jgi:deazaflavin-dependent oxidoreductase (nitroreductase family)
MPTAEGSRCLMAGKVRARFLSVLKHTLNRVTTRLARSGHGPFSLVRHVGRRSGRQYETPLILAEVPGGFVTELTYGADVDWFKNVVAAGGCVVVHHGREYVVRRVLPCTAEQGLAAYAGPRRVVLRALQRHEFRLLSTS